MKIGIYAGTFDPIHEGHIEFAREALKQTELEKVIIVAEKEPYRKKPHASWDHRQAMIERATQNLEQVDHDYAFANQLAHQHSMENMLGVARLHYGKEHEIWFLVGSDVFEHMSEWKELAHSSQYGGFVVAMKNDHTQGWLKERQAELATQGFEVNVVVVNHQKPWASSSLVRNAISEGVAPKNEIVSVTDYIRQHQLYR